MWRYSPSPYYSFILLLSSFLVLYISDAYCNECFISFHKKGARRNHHTHYLHPQLPTSLVAPLAQDTPLFAESTASSSSSSSSSTSSLTHEAVPLPSESRHEDELSHIPHSVDTLGNEYASSLGIAHLSSWKARSAYIPLRLSSPEQKELALMECALFISEYTDHVDIDSYYPSQRKITHYLSELLSIVSGLAVSSDYRAGETLVKGKAFSSYAPFFQHMFEGLTPFIIFFTLFAFSLSVSSTYHHTQLPDDTRSRIPKRCVTRMER